MKVISDVLNKYFFTRYFVNSSAVFESETMSSYDI